ncbi:MAG: hypothetical protein FWG77_02140 [Treponema sp.]|nr:hypothetical protein [Treponema sp.]
MNEFFQNLADVIAPVSNFLTSLGIAVLIPIIIFIIAKALGQTWRKSIVAALTFGVAMIGLNLFIGLLIGTVAPAANNMVEATGVRKDILDVGWPAAAGIAFSTTAGALIIVVSLLVNFIMLLFKATRTINVDIWNFWNHAFTASVVAIASGNLALGLLAGAIHAAACLLIADWKAKEVQEFYGIPGISIPHGWAVTSVPIIIAVNWVLDRIPVIKDIKWDEGTIREKWGVFGNPIVLGAVLGLALGIFGGLLSDIPALFTLAVTVAAVMVLIPKVTAMFMESLTAVSEVARTFFARKFKDRELYIGLDSAILIGHPVTVAAAVVLIPIVLLLSIILPGNRVLALGDLAALVYFVSMVPSLSKGNLFRSIICGMVIMTVVFYVLTSFGSSLTIMATDYAGLSLPEGTTDITALSSGNWITWILFQIGRLFGGSI